MPRYIEFEDSKQVAINDTWQKLGYEVESSYFLPEKKKKICVDIGSNIGAFIYRAIQEDTFEEIYGFEAAFQTYHTSLGILSSKKILGKNVQVFNLAVTHKSGDILMLYANGDESGNATLVRPPSVVQSERCLTISLDDIFDLLNVDHIDYLKMDCEGAEYQVLKASRNLSKIDAIMVEIHFGQHENISNLLHLNGFFTIPMKVGDPHAPAILSTPQASPMLLAINARTYQEDLGDYYKWADNRVKTNLKMLMEDPRSQNVLEDYKKAVEAVQALEAAQAADLSSAK